jgi:3-hydroxy-9,10-secoandrosta-1,3,5(10)-triene-9,17-dione monooxygenase
MTVVHPAPTDTDVHASLVERARALVPVLRARAVATNAARRIPSETIRELQEAGLLRVLQAPKNGGYGLGMRAHLDVTTTLAEGCGSTAWVTGVIHAHSWMMSHFPAPAQALTYGSDPDTVIAAVVAPRGTATRTASGYRLSGTWPFASGSENASYLVLGGAVLDAEHDPLPGEFLIPATAVTYRDDWHVTGLMGTGSCTVTVDDVEVPEEHFLALTALLTGNSPGASLHEGTWNVRAAATPVLILSLAGQALGIARQALTDFPGVIGQKMIAYTSHKQAEHTTTHLHVAQAAALIDQADYHLYRAADDIDRHAQAGTDPDVLARTRIRADCAEAVRNCLEAVELVWRDTGGSGLYATNPLGRALADLQAMNIHGGLMLDTARENYGRALLGLPPDGPFV